MRHRREDACKFPRGDGAPVFCPIWLFTHLTVREPAQPWALSADRSGHAWGARGVCGGCVSLAGEVVPFTTCPPIDDTMRVPSDPVRSARNYLSVRLDAMSGGSRPALCELLRGPNTAREVQKIAW